MKMKQRLDGMRVAILAADGFEQVELTIPKSMLESLGADVEVVSLRPGKIRGMNLMFPGKAVPVDRLIQEADPADYDALLIPGGFVNPDFLRQSQEALAFVRAFDGAQKPIAVLCHGPMVLISADLVRGRRLASWPSLRDDLRNAGAEWFDEPLVRDRNWVSSRGPQDLIPFTEGMVAIFAEHIPSTPREPRKRRSRAGRALRWTATAAALAAVTALARTAVAALRR